MRFFAKRFVEEFLLYSSQLVIFFVVMLALIPAADTLTPTALLILTAFLLLQVGGLLLLFIEGHHPTGECVVEGELGTAMTLLFWSLAWVPSALAAVPWRRFISLCVLP